MQRIILALPVAVLAAVPAYAGNGCSSGGAFGGQTCAVPEISAAHGVAAIAALAALMLFVWERQRRKAA